MARTGSRSGGGVARGLVLTVAVLLAGGATATVVLSEDAQTLRLAVVGALWAFVLAALAAPRRRAATGDGEATPGQELELRRTYEIELEREVAARREYELQLEVYLRRELERGLAEDVQTLREEIQRMRGEVMERLDGELRMERIETTRLIGGGLRALQDEARRLGIGLRVPEPAELLAAGSPPYEPYQPLEGYAAPAPEPYAPYAPASEPYAPSAPYPAPYGSASPYGEPEPPGPPDRPTDAVPSAAADPLPPVPRAPSAGETGSPRRHRHRDDGEANEVMSRLLGR
jgi:hypothetical protein